MHTHPAALAGTCPHRNRRGSVARRSFPSFRSQLHAKPKRPQETRPRQHPSHPKCLFYCTLLGFNIERRESADLGDTLPFETSSTPSERRQSLKQNCGCHPPRPPSDIL